MKSQNTHTHTRTHTLSRTVLLGQHCVWHEGIGVTVSQLIPGVLSDSRDPQGPLTAENTTVHTASVVPTETPASVCEWVGVCACVIYMLASACTFVCVCWGMHVVLHFWFWLLNYLVAVLTFSNMPLPSPAPFPLHRPNLPATCHCSYLPD